MAKVRLKFDIFKPDGTYINPASLMNNIVWSGDIDSPSRELSFNIAWPTFEKELVRTLKIGEGDTVKMFISYNDSEFKEHYRGKILSIVKDSSGQTASIKTKDYGLFLNNKIAMFIEDLSPDKVAEKAIKKIYDKDYAPVSVGKFPKANTKYNKIVTGSSAYDVIQAAYTEASKVTNKKYMTYADLYKINVAEIGENVLSLNFNVGENVMSTKYSSDISSMVNEIIVTDDKGNTVDVKRDNELLKLYQVLMNEVETQSQNGNTKSKGFVKPDKKLSMRCSGNIKLMTGAAINVRDDVTGLVGVFYVIKDKHTFNPYITEVDLSFEKIMHETEISDPSSSSDSGSYGGSGQMKGTKVPAIFTWYCPKGGGINGGNTTASGEKIDYSKKTCAGPPQVAMQSNIQVLGTGTNCDGQVYRKNDHGSDVQILPDGTYRFDLLATSVAEAKKNGRRKGYAIIGPPGKAEFVSNVSGKAGAVIAEARKHLGKPYKWGATGPARFDCSGLVQYCYKSAGISLPRTSKEQATVGKKVSEPYQPGDLLFFGSPIHHVALYIGNNEYIHAPQSGDVVKITKCGRKVTVARRVL